MTTRGRLDLREVAVADVYIDDDLAAHLVRESGDRISFDYGAGQRLTEAAFRERSVSWSLLRTGPVSRCSLLVVLFRRSSPGCCRKGSGSVS